MCHKNYLGTNGLPHFLAFSLLESYNKSNTPISKLNVWSPSLIYKATAPHGTV